MSTFVTPVAHGVALQSVPASAAIPGGRFRSDAAWWVGVPAGTQINAFATGSVQRVDGTANGVPGSPASAWTLFELSPLPQMDATHFKLIPGGLPVQLVIVNAPIAGGPAADDLLAAGAAFVTAPPGSGVTAFLAFAFQDRLCRDPLSWAEAIAASGAVDGAWTQFETDLAALAGSRTLRVLDHRGQPLGSGGVTVLLGANSTVVDLSGTGGDTGVTVGPTESATVNFHTATAPIVAAVGADAGEYAAPLQLAPGARLTQVLDAADWLALPDSGVALPRWNPNSLVEPIVDGTPYFTQLVADMRAAKPSGAVQLAGWAFVKGSLEDDSVEWPLVPGDDASRLLALVNDLHGSGVQVKFLVNEFLQFNVTTIDDALPLSPLLFAAFGILPILVATGTLQADPRGLGVGMLGIWAATILLTTPFLVTQLKDQAELSKSFVDGLSQINPILFTWTPYPAAFEDNPLVSSMLPLQLKGVAIDDVNHVGVYHQKHISIRRADGTYVAYMGGIDLNSDRIDTPLHRAVHPFHDVQLRITGPAAKDIVTSFHERLNYHDPGATAPIVPSSMGSVPAAGSHLVQVARTYFKPGTGSTSRAFGFAPNGETTPIRTIMLAIAQARDFIYIEDQYFSPPDDYIQALLDAAAPARDVRALFITVPYQTDQPYGWLRRADVFSALNAAWGQRLYIGTPLRRFLHPTPALVTNLGRARLASKLLANIYSAELSPVAHLPKAPFFAFVEGELILFYEEDGPPIGTGDTSSQKFHLTRAGGGSGWNANQVDHDAQAPVVAVRIPGIYVHAKMMIVDDVFLFAGSSNLNRRGFYHDGEMDAFAIPQHLLGDPRNPARVLRSRLMAEHVGLTPEMGLSLFADPFSVMPYLSRSWYSGAHRTKMDFFGASPSPGIAIGTDDSYVLEVLKALVGPLLAAEESAAWKLLVDPTTGTEPSLPPLTTGPRYP